MYIVAVFEDRRFGKFEYDDSFEGFNGNEFNGESFIIEIFLVFNLENMKNLSVSVIFYRTVALTNLAI
jgi:hypothetical protein